MHTFLKQDLFKQENSLSTLSIKNKSNIMNGAIFTENIGTQNMLILNETHTLTTAVKAYNDLAVTKYPSKNLI